MNADGKTRDMFQKDNLHLATTGALRLSWAAVNHLGQLVDLAATKVPAPPPSEAPPPDLEERTELPKPTPTSPAAGCGTRSGTSGWR